MLSLCSLLHGLTQSWSASCIDLYLSDDAILFGVFDSLLLFQTIPQEFRFNAMDKAICYNINPRLSKLLISPLLTKHLAYKIQHS